MFSGGGRKQSRQGSKQGNRPDAPGASEKDLYAVLGVSRQATAGDIKKAFRKLAMVHHPDKGGDSDKFKDITFAYDVLSDPQKREVYDSHGLEGLSGGGERHSSGSAEDLLSMMFGGGARPAGRDTSRHESKGRNVNTPIMISLSEAYTGAKRSVSIQRQVFERPASQNGNASRCTSCSGRGYVEQLIRLGPLVQQARGACPNCRGTGVSIVSKLVEYSCEVEIPAGCNDGDKIVVDQKGSESPQPNAPVGDAVFKVSVSEDADDHGFVRSGNDLFFETSVSFQQATSGFRLQVTHLDGRRLILVSEEPLVLSPYMGCCIKVVRGEGMPKKANPYIKGTLFVVIRVHSDSNADPTIDGAHTSEAGNDTICYLEDGDPFTLQMPHGHEAHDHGDDTSHDGPGMSAPQVQCAQQ